MGTRAVMTLDDAIKILRAMDMQSEAKFSPEEHEAILTIGTAGWSGDIQLDDPRLAALPDEIKESIKKLVAVMQTKRIVQ